MAQQSLSIEVPGTDRRLGYLLFVPPMARVEETRRWPVILFLHGSGERGSDLELLKQQGLPSRLEQRDDLPFVVVSPQCPEKSGWQSHARGVMTLLERVLSTTPSDRDRVYLTGVSMGGFGVWYLASRFPETFAAIAPICGYGASSQGFPERLKFLKNVPVWAFHGALDELVHVEESERLVHAVLDYGGNARLTVYPDAGHDAWSRTYEGAALYDWFLTNKRQPG